jgi:hypothetical protein
MKYDWKIKEIVKKDLSNKENVIYKVFWEKIGTDENGNIGKAQGSTLFNTDKVSYDEFVEYDNLTEELVLGWILDTISESYDKRLNKKISNRIEQIKNPSTKVSEFPWSN